MAAESNVPHVSAWIVHHGAALAIIFIHHAGGDGDDDLARGRAYYFISYSFLLKSYSFPIKILFISYSVSFNPIQNTLNAWDFW